MFGRRRIGRVVSGVKSRHTVLAARTPRVYFTGPACSDTHGHVLFLHLSIEYGYGLLTPGDAASNSKLTEGVVIWQRLHAPGYYTW